MIEPDDIIKYGVSEIKDQATLKLVLRKILYACDTTCLPDIIILNITKNVLEEFDKGHNPTYLNGE